MSSGHRLSSSRSWPTHFFLDGGRQQMDDEVTVEEPLEIRVAVGEESPPVPLSVTMRTPGNDRELAAGLLYAEGVVERSSDVLSLEVLTEASRPLDNQVVVRLTDQARLGALQQTRTFFASSACGVCGKSAVDSIFATGFPRLPRGPMVSPALLSELPERMRHEQRLFATTGGIHAAALFSAAGELLLLREDVGRHNAVDKVVGARLLAGKLPAGETVLAVSGRIGFEIAQKALRAGIPILVAVGAPSSLSLRLAQRSGMTVVGFLKPDRFNVYCGVERIETPLS